MKISQGYLFLLTSWLSYAALWSANWNNLFRGRFDNIYCNFKYFYLDLGILLFGIYSMVNLFYGYGLYIMVIQILALSLILTLCTRASFLTSSCLGFPITISMK